MRYGTWLRIVALLCTTALPAIARADCPGMPELIQALERGTTLPAFPTLKQGCGEYEQQLSKALAAYVKSHKAADGRAAVQVVRDGFKKNDWPDTYARVATSVQLALLGSGPDATYRLLDRIHDQGGQAAPPDANPAKPVPPRELVIRVKALPPDWRMPWLFALSIAALVVATAAAGLSAYGSLRKLPVLDLAPTETRLLDRLSGVSTAVQEADERSKESDGMLRTVAADLKSWPPKLESGLLRLSDEIRALPGSAPPAVTDVGALELETLRELWAKVRDHQDVRACLDPSSYDTQWAEILLVELPRLVPEDLRPTFDTIIEPARQHRNLVSALRLIPKLVNGELKRLDDLHEVVRAREHSQLLLHIQTSGMSERLSFRLERWITDSFLGFADLYLQKYQQTQMEARAGNDFDRGIDIVRRVLRIASVDPIDVKLGITRFDSAHHIGRSTSSDTRYADGVITGVVRNGFIEGGQHVIRQPEVIVNRMR